MQYLIRWTATLRCENTPAQPRTAPVQIHRPSRPSGATARSNFDHDPTVESHMTTTRSLVTMGVAGLWDVGTLLLNAIPSLVLLLSRSSALRVKHAQ